MVNYLSDMQDVNNTKWTSSTIYTTFDDLFNNTSDANHILLNTETTAVVTGAVTDGDSVKGGQAFAAWEKVADLHFTPSTIASAQLAILTGTIPGFPDGKTPNVLNTTTHKYVLVNSILESTAPLSEYIHEVGHALGLDHPGHDPNTSGLAGYSKDTTVMSYIPGTNAKAANIITPMIYDIAVIQHMYGASSYGLNFSNTFTLYECISPRAQTIWDAGGTGTDTITIDNLSSTKNATIDLRGGLKGEKPRWSHIGNDYFAIALDLENPSGTNTKGIVQIENAESGNGDDRLFGNTGDNHLKANGGKDVLYGDNGNDLLDGGAGEDWLDGGAGINILHGGTGADTFVAGIGQNYIDDAETQDKIIFMGTVLHGGFRAPSSELPWAKDKNGLINYGVNKVGDLIIHNRENNSDTFVGAFNTSTSGNNRTAGIMVGEVSMKFYRLLEAPGGAHTYDNFQVLFGPYLKTLTGNSYFKGVDPLVLDLDGDGLELNTRTSISPFFDIDADGFGEQTGWARGDDGFLVRDTNLNGVIDNLSEMFGSDTIGGFADLAALDSTVNGGNGDGFITSVDDEYTTLRVWRDIDGDGVTDTLGGGNELFSLGDLGITSINLTPISLRQSQTV